MEKMANEAALQRAVATYLNHRRALWCHVANERHTKTRRKGGFFVGQGVKSGVPDVLIFEARGGYHGFAMELKNGRRRLQPSQKKWLSDLETAGWRTCVCYYFDEAVSEIDAYLSAPLTTVRQ